ncbi:hypothetical protein CU097_007899 [Rhizopus azygosporus]|uniref:Uncharacterized protein n=1 Tax=Rhizopus azygosporus TaxID=86630 RepID=A0A367J738_RHIAZ|nr:hypothetical protein CU097_007899 [Rhizopus azygosporus]
MDLEYYGIYRMAELDHFHLPKSVTDLVLTKHTIECLLKIKVVVTRTLVNINKLKSGQLPANPKYQHHQRFVNCEQSKVRKTKD